MESLKYKTMAIFTFLCITILVLLGIILFNSRKEKKEMEQIISCSTTLHTLDAIAMNYKGTTGKDIYDESRNIQELLDTLVRYHPHPTFFNILKKRLNDKKFILYLIKSGNEGSTNAPVIICQLSNGQCLTMTRGRKTFSTWDRENSRFIPTSIFNKINNQNTNPKP